MSKYVKLLTGRREKEGAKVVAEIKKTGGTATFIRTDVAKEGDVAKAVNFVLSTHGRLDVAFNNAGVEIVGPLDQVTEENIGELLTLDRDTLTKKPFEEIEK